MSYLPLRGPKHKSSQAGQITGQQGEPAATGSASGLGSIPASGPVGAELVDSITDTVTALESLSAFKLIWLSDHTYADKDDTARINSPIAITVTDAQQGNPVRVVLSGLVVNPAWSWIAGEALYLGDDGQFTQTAPATAWKIGDALSPTKINFMPTFLNADSIADGAIRTVVTAVGSTSGHRVIFLSDQSYADRTDVARAGELIGLTENGATVGQPLSVLLDGLITEPSWNWMPGFTLYLSGSGQMTHTPPASGPATWWDVGHAITETQIYFKPGLYIVRA